MSCGKMTPRIRNGQSTLEYVIILAVVVGAIIAAGVIFKPNLTSTYNMIYPSVSNPAETDISNPAGTGTQNTARPT
ncbi:MAG: hypothetical protein Q8N80_06260 [Candidatus Omnitrophota bacterium]|nr:hypothetical protein [Candidatus Omnitrophota bacterium]